MQISDGIYELLTRGNRGDLTQLRFKRLEAPTIRGGLIHAGRVEISNDFNRLRPPRRLNRSLLQNLAQNLAVVLSQLVIARPKYLVWRDRVVLAPCATCVFIKVVAWIYALIERPEIKGLRTLDPALVLRSAFCRTGLGWAFLGHGKSCGKNGGTTEHQEQSSSTRHADSNHRVMQDRPYPQPPFFNQRGAGTRATALGSLSAEKGGKFNDSYGFCLEIPELPRLARRSAR